MLAGDALVRWTPRVQEWQECAEYSWERTRRLDGWVGGELVLFVRIPSLCSGEGLASHPALFSQGAWLVLSVVGLGMVLVGRDSWLYRQRLGGWGSLSELVGPAAA